LEAENELEPTVFQSTVLASPDIRDERVSAFLARYMAGCFAGLLITAGNGLCGSLIASISRSDFRK